MRQLVLTVMLLVGIVSLAEAQSPPGVPPNCTAVNVKSEMWQYGSRMSVQGFAQSTRGQDICGGYSKMRVESWVDLTSSGVSTAEMYGTTAAVNFIKQVPQWGHYDAQGKHWTISFNVSWRFDGYSHAAADVNPPQIADGWDGLGDEECDDSMSPEEMTSDCRGKLGYDSPLLVDTGRNGFELSSVDDGVMFDINGDGVLDQVAWTRPDTDDGWLAIDRNGNGRIDDGTELFGNNAPSSVEGHPSSNGFVALEALQNPEFGVSPSDGRFDVQDAMFGKLLIWIDTNHNGLSEPEELQSAASIGLQSVDLNYKRTKRVDQFGNRFSLRSTATWVVEKRNGKQVERDRPIWDVWLRTAKSGGTQ